MKKEVSFLLYNLKDQIVSVYENKVYIKDIPLIPTGNFKTCSRGELIECYWIYKQIKYTDYIRNFIHKVGPG